MALRIARPWRRGVLRDGQGVEQAALRGRRSLPGVGAGPEGKGQLQAEQQCPHAPATSLAFVVDFFY